MEKRVWVIRCGLLPGYEGRRSNWNTYGREGSLSVKLMCEVARLAVVSFQHPKVARLVLENIQQMSSWPLFHANARNDDDNPSLKGGEVVGSGGYDESDASSHPALHAPGGVT